MAKITLRPVETGDLQHLAENLCEGERMTWSALYGDVPIFPRLVSATMNSDPCEVGVLDGGPLPLLVVGVVPVGEGVGHLWMVATDEAFTHPRALKVAGQRYVNRVSERFGRLVGRIDARHTKTLRWLESMNFRISTSERKPEDKGLEFKNFELRNGERNVFPG